jgi:enediyne biosynthesis protein E4
VRRSILIIVCLAATVRVAGGQRATTPTPSDAPPRFTNIAPADGVDFRHVNGGTPDRLLLEIMGSGGLFFDYNEDGWVDVFIVDGGSLVNAKVDATARDRLYRNRGNGTFEDVSAASGITHSAYGMGTCAADYDNDGWTDLYVTAVGPNRLYHNDGGKRFSDVTAKAGVAGSPVFSTSCAFMDVDRDNDVDLFVVNYVDARIDNNAFCGDTTKKIRIYCHPLNFAPLQNVLYRNNGNGTFTDVSREAGIAGHKGNGLGIVSGDYDDDGLPDIFVANDTTPNFLFHNEGRGVFKEVALLSGVAVAADGRARAGMGTDFGDYDGDGDLDLFVTNHEMEAHTLFRNLGKGLFEDVTFPSGVGPPTLPFVGFGAGFLDIDNDSDLDLAIVNGHVMNSASHFRPGAKEAQRNLLLRNEGNGRFRDATRQAGPGFEIENVSRTLAAADIDNDGDLDLLVTNNAGVADLLRNGGVAGSNSLSVKLVGTQSNRNAIGARVRATAGGKTQVREVRAGSSYLGQHDLRVHFGLGRTTAIERLEIRWPNGQTETVPGVTANQIVTITEGKGVTGRVATTR